MVDEGRYIKWSNNFAEGHSPFVMNRWYGQYNSLEDAAFISKNSLLTDLDQISPSEQRRIRKALNTGKPEDQQISYESIKPTSKEFKKKNAKLVITYYKSSKYLDRVQKGYSTKAFDPEVKKEISSYDAKKLHKHFSEIPQDVTQEIIKELKLPSKKIDAYSDASKKKILTAFKSLYME